MLLLLGPALALVLRPADLLPVGVAVLDQWRPADLHRLLHCLSLVGEEAVLDVVVVAFFLLEKFKTGFIINNNATTISSRCSPTQLHCASWKNNEIKIL